MEVTIPHNFTPRPYQLPFFRAMDSGIKRAALCWHRRSGKEKSCINYTARAAFERVGTYYYLFPTYGQAKRVVWDGRDKDGVKFTAHFPDAAVRSKNETELKITLANGSVFQLIGTDNMDSVVGANPIGCVFSEYALQNPLAWDLIRPILLENGGWAVFNLTPRGKNHGYELFKQAQSNPDWFASLLTVRDTGVITEAQIDEERRSGLDEDLIQQEYYCSFEGVQRGAVFGLQMEQAEKEGRVCSVPWQPEFAVSTWWDIGTGDPTAIWFTQDVGREIHVIDCYENAGVGVGIDFYVKHLQGLPYVWGTHNGPHDIEAHSFAAGGKSAKEVAAQLGFHFNTVPRIESKTDSINAARTFMQRCYFDKAKTERGRAALTSYHYHYDERRKVFSDTPFHDWSSNYADAFQQLAMGHKFAAPKREKAETRRVYTLGSGGNDWMSR